MHTQITYNPSKFPFSLQDMGSAPFFLLPHIFYLALTSCLSVCFGWKSLILLASLHTADRHFSSSFFLPFVPHFVLPIVSLFKYLRKAKQHNKKQIQNTFGCHSVSLFKLLCTPSSFFFQKEKKRAPCAPICH
uniref:Uncharacterized protein n=1 Tax=Trypanosoma congolense (strain IL3000) TaxID=1068625 RepID=G0UNE5_TRYCI|nr:hypothetical protein, unlikely [Trypanosoma congolense IL3000]